MKLENELHTTTNFDLIEKKKSDLKNLRQEKLQGCYIRSKIQWAEEGEKPSIFFIYLETKHFTHKTIPKLVNASGNVVTDQNQIFQEAKIYYENLYSKRDTVSNINLKNEIPYTAIPTLSDEIKNNLEGEIAYAELTASIKRMKNEKSPGSNGFTREFFKFFLNNLENFFFQSINYGYKTGQLHKSKAL
jgi:hypothetical protein